MTTSCWDSRANAMSLLEGRCWEVRVDRQDVAVGAADRGYAFKVGEHVVREFAMDTWVYRNRGGRNKKGVPIRRGPRYGISGNCAVCRWTIFHDKGLSQLSLELLSRIRATESGLPQRTALQHVQHGWDSLLCRRTAWCSNRCGAEQSYELSALHMIFLCKVNCMEGCIVLVKREWTCMPIARLKAAQRPQLELF